MAHEREPEAWHVCAVTIEWPKLGDYYFIKTLLLYYIILLLLFLFPYPESYMVARTNTCFTSAMSSVLTLRIFPWLLFCCISIHQRRINQRRFPWILTSFSVCAFVVVYWYFLYIILIRSTNFFVLFLREKKLFIAHIKKSLTCWYIVKF